VGAEHRLARAILEEAHRIFVEQVRDLTLEEALDAARGYRSILGLTKHVAGWSAVYRSYAVDNEPRHWDATEWPRGLRDHVDPSAGYVEEIFAWFEATYGRWLEAIADGIDLDEPRRVHWGGTAPMRDIVAMVAAHWTYHAGEINEILALRRGEAWEDGEEVEENHIDTTGHRVRPPWLSGDSGAPRADEPT